MKKFIAVLLFLVLIIAGAYYLTNPFRPVTSDSKVQTFIVSETNFQDALVEQELEDKGFVRSFWALDLALTLKNRHDKIQPGGYYLSKNMDTWQIADKISSQKPDLKWVTLVEGLRKEQIGERLQEALGWSNQELDKWNTVYTAMKFDDIEGVYFPDTYLISVKETGFQIAQRMINRFNEKAGADVAAFGKKDILWTTGLKIASIIQREAAGSEDMPLISGIIWNRLDKEQALQVDATIQYAKGKVDDQWWSVVTPQDIDNIDSPYNTYQFKGLPPHPISNPGLTAINAALNPQATDCIYYLHDHHGQIHCAVTYEEHLENIKKYLN
jgi:UPF0755 protein